eukprot:CAMPEP_0194335722 /NCGR_PEP_ID=MMETSP0171-20130528/70521_1 /TAXON_ID=218684 /ORGANISM="Corethron pennatum, Strain L29A3" /LENGTH=435 /DNA_ID=CAMNT_0039098919 /DNA_START=304 /DNA_END=1610 /DNA_ORIENTATION=+
MALLTEAVVFDRSSKGSRDQKIKKGMQLLNGAVAVVRRTEPPVDSASLIKEAVSESAFDGPVESSSAFTYFANSELGLMAASVSEKGSSPMPSLSLTVAPSSKRDPSVVPSVIPSVVPSVVPSAVPSVVPSVIPSVIPSGVPSLVPSVVPSVFPSVAPSVARTKLGTFIPSKTPFDAALFFPPKTALRITSAPSITTIITSSSIPSKNLSNLEKSDNSLSSFLSETDTGDETPCEDDSDFFWLNVVEFNCNWVGQEKIRRCNYLSEGTLIRKYCQKSCGTCVNLSVDSAANEFKALLFSNENSSPSQTPSNSQKTKRIVEHIRNYKNTLKAIHQATTATPTAALLFSNENSMSSQTPSNSNKKYHTRNYNKPPPPPPPPGSNLHELKAASFLERKFDALADRELGALTNLFEFQKEGTHQELQYAAAAGTKSPRI